MSENVFNTPTCPQCFSRNGQQMIQKSDPLQAWKKEVQWHCSDCHAQSIMWILNTHFEEDFLSRTVADRRKEALDSEPARQRLSPQERASRERALDRNRHLPLPPKTDGDRRMDVYEGETGIWVMYINNPNPVVQKYFVETVEVIKGLEMGSNIMFWPLGLELDDAIRKWELR